MSEIYKRLVIDPRCLRPSTEGHTDDIYIDAIDAINKAQKSQYCTKSEERILNTIKKEVRKNRFK